MGTGDTDGDVAQRDGDRGLTEGDVAWRDGDMGQTEGTWP